MTKPSINWDHVAPEFVAMATDADGDTYIYSRAISPHEKSGEWYPNGKSSIRDPSIFASFTPGTCDWRDSLVIRPGYEEIAE